jgi:hypothetical protein
MSEEQQSGDLNDFMEGIGLSVKATDPENAFMINFTDGAYRKVATFMYWLRHELFCYYDLEEQGLDLYKTEFNKETGLTHRIKATKDDFAMARTIYYIHMKFQSWITWDVSGIGKVDVNKAAKMVLELPEVARMVAQKKDDLPKN